MLDLRSLFERLVLEASELLATDPNRLLTTWDREWRKIVRKKVDHGVSYTFPAEIRRSFGLSANGKVAVAKLPAATQATAALLAHPNVTSLLPVTSDSEGQTVPHGDPTEELRSTFVVGFVSRYIAPLGASKFNAARFGDLFTSLEELLLKRVMTEELVAPLLHTQWEVPEPAAELGQSIRLELFDDDRREWMLNNGAPAEFSHPNLGMFNMLEAGACLVVCFRHGFRQGGPPPEAQALLKRSITALRLAAPGALAATTMRTGQTTVGWALGSSSSPLDYKSSGAPVYIVSRQAIAAAKTILTELENLSEQDRRALDLPIERFHRSFDYRRREERVVDLMIVVDALFGEKGPGAVYKASMRLPVFITGDRERRHRLNRLIRAAYRMRSAIVHGGDVAPQPEGLGDLSASDFLIEVEGLVRDALLSALRFPGYTGRHVTEIPSYADHELLLRG